MFKEEQAKKGGVPSGAFDEAESTYKSQIKILEEDYARLQVSHTVYFHDIEHSPIEWLQRIVADMKKRYEREFVLMSSVVHAAGMINARNHLGNQQARLAPTAWLPQQRRNVCYKIIFSM